jgi:hypothetical protein
MSQVRTEEKQKVLIESEDDPVRTEEQQKVLIVSEDEPSSDR